MIGFGFTHIPRGIDPYLSLASTNRVYALEIFNLDMVKWHASSILLHNYELFKLEKDETVKSSWGRFLVLMTSLKLLGKNITI